MRALRSLRRIVVIVGLSSLVLLLAGQIAAAELAPGALPALTGRVVDDAHLLSDTDKAALAGKLRALEDQSTIQLVVATVPSLQGEEIEPYANALFRKWRLGKKDENNGVLFLIAPTERKIRFEVGYGLEGTLTDALTKLILRNAVGPKLKAGDSAGAINAGVDEATAILTKDKAEWKARPALQDEADQPLGTAGVVILMGMGGAVLLVLFLLWRFRRSINWTSGASSAVWAGTSSGGSSVPTSGGGDSFSGGGGDSGGGGSSDSY